MSDLISRQAAIDKAVYTETEEGWSGFTVDVKYIESLPSVNPQPKTGHWIEHEYLDCEFSYQCSNCNEFFVLDDGTPEDYDYNYCPVCGARMIDPKESDE